MKKVSLRMLGMVLAAAMMIQLVGCGLANFLTLAAGAGGVVAGGFELASGNAGRAAAGAGSIAAGLRALFTAF